MAAKNQTNEQRQQDYSPEQRKVDLMYDEEYLQNRLAEGAKELNALSKSNQTTYKRLKKTEIVVASAVPLIIIISTIPTGAFSTVLTVLASVGSAVLIFMNNVLKLGNFYDKWKEYRSRSESLKREQYLYLTGMPPYDEEDAYPALVERVENLLADQEKESEHQNV